MFTRLTTVLMTVVMCGVLSFSAHASDVRPVEPVKFSYDTLANYTIYFRHDKAVIDSNYLDNRKSLSAIRAVLSELASDCPESIETIIIEGHSSPVGNTPYNQKLSLQRAQKAEAFLRAIPGIENVDMQAYTKDYKVFNDETNGIYHLDEVCYIGAWARFDINTSTGNKDVYRGMAQLDNLWINVIDRQ